MTIDILIVPGDSPVCTYNAFKLVVIPKKILDYIFAKAVPDVFSGGVLIP